MSKRNKAYAYAEVRLEQALMIVNGLTVLPVQRLQVWLYISNVALLLAHEIDSAYWHEWELFHLPGGVQGFVLLHVPLIALLLYGLTQVVLDAQGSRAYSGLVALSGLTAVGLHSWFLAIGDR